MKSPKATQRCILVYNPHSGHGHLDSWNALFVSLLLDAGWKVLVLTPNPDDLQQRLTIKKQERSERLQILDWNVPLRTFKDRVVGKLLRMGHRIVRNTVKKDNFESATSDSELHFFEPIEFANRVRLSLTMAKWKPEIVFNMYMDMYRTDPARWKLFDQKNAYLWTGIRFVPRPTPNEGYYNSPSFAGMCFLDDRVRDFYQSERPEKSFAYLPDITETSLPDKPSDLVQEILLLAKERKIVFLGGSIGGNKNLAKWYELIDLADPQKWFFVQIGEIHQSTLAHEDIVALNKILEQTPENVYVKTEYLQSEAVFNDVISASDILFAVYRDFTISSNMIGKAAAFERPILVADQYLMGERVRHYQIGITTPEDDAQTMYECMKQLMAQPIPVQNYAAYRHDFSLSIMKRNFLDFLDQIITSPLQK